MLRLAYPRYISRNLQQFILSTRLLSSTAIALDNNDEKTEGDNLKTKKKNVQSAVNKTTPGSSLKAAKDLQKDVIKKQSSLLENTENVNVTEENKTNVTPIKKTNRKNWKNKRKKKPVESNIKDDVKRLDDKTDKTKSPSIIDELDLSQNSIEDLRSVIDKLHSAVYSEPDKKTTSVSSVKARGRGEKKEIGKKVDDVVKTKLIPERKGSDLNVALKEAGTRISRADRRKKWVSEKIADKISKRKGKEKEFEKVKKMIESPEILQETESSTNLLGELKTFRKKDISSDKKVEISSHAKKKDIPSDKKVEISSHTKRKDGRISKQGAKETSLASTSTDSKQLKNRKQTRKVIKQPEIDLLGGLSTDLFSGCILNEHSYNIYTQNLHEKCWLDKIENLKQTNIKDTHPNSFEVMMLGTEKHWKFPIDNEQDIGAEEFISFEDHVFLERYLNEFPDVDAIQKYMELVITGLQQNPYLSVEEKRTRILWHKDYFENVPNEDEDLSLSR